MSLGRPVFVRLPEYPVLTRGHLAGLRTLRNETGVSSTRVSYYSIRQLDDGVLRYGWAEE